MVLEEDLLFRPLGKRAWKHLSLLARSNDKWEVEERIPFHLSKSCRGLALPSFHLVGHLMVKQSMPKCYVQVRGQVGIAVQFQTSDQCTCIPRIRVCARLDGVHVPYLGDMSLHKALLVIPN